MTTAISAHNVVKTFGATRALDGLDLAVETGEVHGFLGPNGAGKSTTIRILLGLMRADAGELRLLGGDPWREAATLHRRLAYVPGDVNLWPNLTGGEAIDLLSRLRGGIDEKRRASLLERFDLDPTKKARSYSKGNRQKVALVAALASDAELLLLDEPTSGLDPLMEATFQEVVREIREEGRTILLSSHILAEAEALCDRVSIIRSGRIVQTGSLAELRQLTRTTVLVATELPVERPGRRAWRAARRAGRRQGPFRRRHRPPRRGDGVPGAAADPFAGQSPAHAGGALPPPVRRGRGGAGPMMAFTGTPHLVRLALRRDRIRLSVWVLALVGITAASAAGVASTYDTAVKIASYQRNIGSSPASIAMSGPPVALDRIGGIIVFETSLTVLLGVALMATFTVIRHTRAEEEVGRTELLASAVVGRHAGTAAAVLVAVSTSVLIGAGVTGSVLTQDFPTGPALLYGASVAVLGIFFAAVATVAAQLMSHARTALGATIAVLGAAFALRAIGDVQDSFLTWLSPIGWSQGVHILDGDSWWPLLLSVVVAGGLFALAGWLTARRDVGAGVLPDRPGPARASRLLSSPLGLAWRLQRGTVLAWAVGLALLGGVFGSVTEQLQDMVKDNPTLQQYFADTGGSITDAFFAVALLFMGLGAAGFAVASALRLHAEENAGRVEPVLSTAVSRWRMLLSPLVVTVGGAILLVTVGGLGVGLADAVIRGDFGSVGKLTMLAWVQLPAVLVLVGLAVLLMGWLPRATAVAWAAMGFAFVVGWLGGLIRLPSWAKGLSPFEHLPQVPVDEVAVAPLVVLTLLGVALTAVGAVGFRRRDIA